MTSILQRLISTTKGITMVHKDAKISLDAYLNSEADELATTTELNILQEKPIVPLDPKMLSCNFHIDGRTITRNFKKSIRQTIQFKLLLQQIRLE